MAKLCNERQKCDVTIIVGEKRIYGHKELLSARIPFFQTLFNSNMAESKEGAVVTLSSKLCSFDISTIEKLILYAYTGQLTISDNNVQNMMLCANYLRIEAVLDECGVFMRNRIRIDNILPLFIFCRSMAYDRIEEFVLRFIDKNFVPLSMMPDFHVLPVDDLLAFLQRDSLNVDNERQIFDAITRWIGNDFSKMVHGARLLKCVRLNRLPYSFLKDAVQKTRWVIQSSECMDLVNDMKEYPVLGQDRRNHPFKNTERVCAEAHRLIFSIGDNSIQLYDPIKNTWTKAPMKKLVQDRRSNIDKVAVIDHKIYIFGDQVRDSGAIFDTITNEWDNTKMPDMPFTRYFVAIGAIDGKIFLAGGHDGMPITLTSSSLDRYDPASQEWCSLAPMTYQRAYPGSCVLDGRLYVFGGHDDLVQACNYAEFYDPEMDSWTTIRRMKKRRCGCAAAALNGQIYVVGGIDGAKCLRAVEKYDPSTNTWTKLRSMNTVRVYATLAVSCGKLFVIGGYDSNSCANALTTVEMYIPESNTWKRRASMIGDYSFNVGVLPIPASFPSPVVNIEDIQMDGFRSFLLKPELFKAIMEIEFVNPFDVQYECLPQAINGNDLICQAKPGMGKTATFVISTLQQLEHVDKEISVLVVCNSYERACQIKKEYTRFSKYMPNVKVDVVPFAKNKNGLENNCPRIIIGTPQCIYDIFTWDALKLRRIKHLVLDEGDHLINDIGARRQLEKVLNMTPPNTQVMIFSTNLKKTFCTECKQFVREGPKRFQYLRE